MASESVKRTYPEPNNSSKKKRRKRSRGDRSFRRDPHLDDDFGNSDSDCEMDSDATKGMTGIITKLGEWSRGKPAGLVSFLFKNGVQAVGKFAEDQASANGFLLKDMRRFTLNPALTFPFRVGMKVDIVGCRQLRSAMAPYIVRIRIGKPDNPKAPLVLERLEGKNIPYLNGRDFVGTVVSYQHPVGIAAFRVDNETKDKVSHFAVKSVRIAGEEISQSVYNSVFYVGMNVPLRVTCSFSTKIPGIYHEAETTLDLPWTTGAKGPAQPLQEFRGVVLKGCEEGPTVFSFGCKENKLRRFYVVCDGKPATAGCKPARDCDLYFGLKSIVLGLLAFSQRYEGGIRHGCVYRAVVDLPLRIARVTKLFFIRGMLFPRNVTCNIDGKEKQILLIRNSIKVEGIPPEPPFPGQFFRGNMQIPLNDIWVMSDDNYNYRATLNLSKRILSKQHQLQSDAGRITPTAITAALEEVPEARFPPKPNSQVGVVSALAEGTGGYVLPSEVSAIIDGKECTIVIPADQVFVNGKTGIFLPPNKVPLGGKIKVHNVHFCEETKTHRGKLLYFYPKVYLEEIYNGNAPEELK